MYRITLCFMALILVSACRTTTDSGDTKGTDYILEVGQAPSVYPTQLAFVRNLSMIGRDEVMPTDQVRFEGNDVFGIDDVEITQKDYWNSYFPSFPLKYDVAWGEHCAQLVKNVAGTQIVMFHLASCPTEEVLLPATSLRFYLLVGTEFEKDIRKGLNDFVSWPLHFRGYRVGSMHKKVKDSKEMYYIGDLCDSRGGGEWGSPDEDASDTICDVQLMGKKVIGVKMKENRSGTPVALTKSGYFYPGDDATTLTPTSCIQETARNVACTAHADRMSSGCTSVGLQLIDCRGCLRVCEGQFPVE